MPITRWPQNVRRFLALDPADRWLLLRAVVRLGIARLQITFVPFERLAARLSESPAVRDPHPDPELLERIRFAIAAAAARTPWRSDCFPQTIAGRALLRRYGYGSVIHLGVERAGHDSLAGHAWLTCGDVIVAGGDDVDRYTEIHRFSG